MFAIDAHSLARETADREAAVDEIFRMTNAAWEVTSGLTAPPLPSP
jgi:hypothetical protein